jgi:hypothetical protein
MMPQRAATILASAAFAIASSAALAQGQVPDATVLNIMRECAKIDDPSARLACYDNNIRSAGGRPTVPGQGGRVSGGGAPLAGRGGNGLQGFGAESVRSQERFQSAEQRGLGPDAISARILAVRQREPGIYLVTLEGGAQWLFSESVAKDFSPPRKGDTVDISRAALGSFLMRFDNQESVRVRRIK